VQAGEKVVIVGAGGLGLNGVQIVRAVGAEVAVIDPSGGARERALELGASLVVGPDEADQVRDWSDGGVDVGFDASGALSGFRTALASLRPGGRLACVGYQVGLDFPFDSSRLVLEEITLLGARAGKKAEAAEALRAVEGGAIHPQIMDRLPLEQINEGLNRLKAGQVVGRLVIEMGR
jgi:alcohol dehydrogenase, propanol-preferring